MNHIGQEGTRFARLEVEGKVLDLPILVGTEGEMAIDISGLRRNLGFIAYDPGYADTASCTSAITYVDGENGVLRYRGYDIEELAAQGVKFIPTAWLLIFGELPTDDERAKFRELLTTQELLHEGMLKFFDALPPHGDPLAILSAAVQCSSLYNPEFRSLEPRDTETTMVVAAKLLSKVRTIAAFSYKKATGEPFIYPNPELDYCSNFLHMMFSIPNRLYRAPQLVADTLNLFLMLHADHEQNCSTSTVRIVGSTRANLFDSVSAGISALSGPLHGGANIEVIRMLERIYNKETTVRTLVETVKKKGNYKGRARLNGFGHRVYKNYDPRARILKKEVLHLLKSLDTRDPLFDIAIELEETALRDDYFRENRIFPNVDFYSGILLRAIKIPLNMFTVMFAIARTAGWIAQWREEELDPSSRLQRPRQIYMGPPQRICLI
jgi:citrate synthase